MNNDKLIKTAGILDRIVKVCHGFFRAFVIVFLIFAVLVLIFGEKMFAEGSLTLELAFLRLHMSESYQDVTELMKLYTVVGLVSAGVICFVVQYAASILRGILSPMKEGRPFEAGVSRNLKKIAWVVLIGGAVTQVLGLAELAILAAALPFEQIFSVQAVANVEFAFTLDFSFVVIFGILMFLSYIFSYGQALQQESDETL